MKDDGQIFILAGNGPYQNHGCEAIVRGTVKILREQFDNPRFICISHFQSERQYSEQKQLETDETITHLAAYKLTKNGIKQNFWKPETWSKLYQCYLDRDAYYSRVYREMLPYIGNAGAVLSVGGDNYSLDYGKPIHFTALDDLVIKNGRPIVLWGASVGPFSAIPEYEQYMISHLQQVDGIFARESATVEYLHGIGVNKNVYAVADPAFLMDPAQPADIKETSIEKDAIGINLSPLMAKYVSGGDLEQWSKISASIVEKIAKTTGMPIYLIPHVVTPNSNDYLFMQRVLSHMDGERKNVTLVPPKYGAAEIKWIISRMTLFAGARTHSTIAALSSGIPTLSFAYSIKARGINKDIYWHNDFCIDPININADIVTAQITSMLDQNLQIRKNLSERVKVIQRSALSAGSGLKRIVEGET